MKPLQFYFMETLKYLPACVQSELNPVATLSPTVLSSALCSHSSKYMFVVGPHVSVSSFLRCANSQVRHAVIVTGNKISIDVDLDSASVNEGSNFNVKIVAHYRETVGEDRIMNVGFQTGKSKGENGGEPGLHGVNYRNLRCCA